MTCITELSWYILITYEQSLFRKIQYFKYAALVFAIYGAVFGQIVGGDNVIDNVQLDLSKINIYMNGDKGQYVPVGGYVGVIIDGGLVFRNMSGSISGLTDNTRVISLEEKILLIIFKPEKIKRNYAFLNFMCNMLIIRHLVLYFTALVAGQLTLDNGNKTC